jgi:hypothetical protein
VRLGDLRLVKEVTTQAIVASREIPHKRTGAVKRRVPEVVGVRKVHHARVVGFQEDFTAIVYEGSDFEKVGPMRHSPLRFSRFLSSIAMMQDNVKTFGDLCCRCSPLQFLTYCLRHPSLVQLFGVTSSGRLKALIYHDG